MADLNLTTDVGIIAGGIKDVVDKIWPNPTDAEMAKIALLKQTVDGQVALYAAQNAAAIAEAKSEDPWTSRARPAFLYVFYALLLWSIPLGIVGAIAPTTALNILSAQKNALGSIPDNLWNVFGICFSVYAGGRSWEKIKGVGK